MICSDCLIYSFQCRIAGRAAAIFSHESEKLAHSVNARWAASRTSRWHTNPNAITQKDRGSGRVNARIGSVADPGGGMASESDVRMLRELRRMGIFKARHEVIISDGAAWIRKMLDRLLVGLRVTWILDSYHAFGYVGDAVNAITSNDRANKQMFEKCKAKLLEGAVRQVNSWLKPHCDKHAAAEACSGILRTMPTG